MRRPPAAGNLVWIELARIAHLRHVPQGPAPVRRVGHDAVVDRDQHAWLSVEYLAVFERRFFGDLFGRAPGRTPRACGLQRHGLSLLELAIGIELRTSLAE